MALKPVVHWSENVPFVKKFPDVLKDDMMIVVCGKIPETAKYFVINLQQGSDTQEIPFHFGFRCEDGTEKVLYSTQKGNQWAPMSDTCCNFGNKQNGFRLNFFIWNNCYQACVNGKHILTYDHTPDRKIDTINIYGDVQINSVKLYDLHCT